MFLPKPPRRAVLRLRGASWFPVDGRPEDMVLGPGQRYRFLRTTHAVVAPVRDASFLTVDMGDEATLYAFDRRRLIDR